MKRTSVLLTALLALAAACAESRPTFDVWKSDWERVSTGIPTRADLESDSSRSTCEEALALVQTSRTTLLPTPDKAIDDTVSDWLGLARGTYFDCPPPEGFDDAYATLDRLAAEIAVVISIDQSVGNP